MGRILGWILGSLGLALFGLFFSPADALPMVLAAGWASSATPYLNLGPYEVLSGAASILLIAGTLLAEG